MLKSIMGKTEFLKTVQLYHSVVSSSLQPRGLYSQWNSPGQNTGVDSLSLLQGIFPTQGSNPGLLHCRWILYQMSHKGSPRILVWVAYPFSSGSFRPRNQTRVSCIAGGFFTTWAIREALVEYYPAIKKYLAICNNVDGPGGFMVCEIKKNTEKDKYSVITYMGNQKIKIINLTT